MNTAISIPPKVAPVGQTVRLQTLLEIWAEEQLRCALDGTSTSTTSTIALIRELHMGDLSPKLDESKPWTQRIYGKDTKSYRTGAMPEHPIADAIEHMLTGPYLVHAPMLTDSTRTEAQDLSLRANRADFYLIICAEWLGMVPQWQPEAWRASWRGMEFQRSVLAMHQEMRGWKWQRIVRGHKEPMTEYRGRLARALGIKTKGFRAGERSENYERHLYSAQTYLGCLPWFQQLMFPTLSENSR
ncbi:MAG TPA: hypothetical protein VGH91_04575 [Gammaproteobacteria bacterium]|jgi:hypothetical protein